MNRIRPGTACLACQRPLFSKEAKRIVALGETLIRIDRDHARYRVFPEVHNLPGTPDLKLLLHGPWLNEQTRRSALESARANRHPWICQTCTGEVWALCKHPIAHACGLSAIHDDGNILYAAHFSGYLPKLVRGCLDPQCMEYWKAYRDRSKERGKDADTYC